MQVRADVLRYQDGKSPLLGTLPSPTAGRVAKLRQHFIKTEMHSHPKVLHIDISGDELSKILEVVPRGESLDKGGFRSRLVNCIRGFAVVDDFREIIPWTQADASKIARLGKLASELHKVCSELSDAAKHLLDYIGESSPLYANDLIEFAKTFHNAMNFAVKYNPMPDDGRSRDDMKSRFLFVELAEIWEILTEERPKRSEKLRESGSPVGEFGLMVWRVLELMSTKGLISEDEVPKFQKSILFRLSKPNRLL
jgi:hypothetical protein